MSLPIAVELRRTESHTEVKAKPQKENAEESVLSLTALKRAKTAGLEEARPKKRS